LISDVPTTFSYVYYVPNAEIENPSKPEGMSAEDLWTTLDFLLDEFENSGQLAIFALTEKFDWAYRDIMLIEPDDPQLLAFSERLSENTLIYDNGHTRIYKNDNL
jgi:hypothetical protein